MPKDHLKPTPDQILQRLTVLSGEAENKYLMTKDKKWSRAANSINRAAQKISASPEFQAQRPK